ncbi:MAG: T9SS type A sorting domain-containing protein, partial [Candidatus Cloacimonetes bacterium]|nr:T9SS type A sorting domain-containing protein [Candidatus Cloacimonadota bacterium]
MYIVEIKTVVFLSFCEIVACNKQLLVEQEENWKQRGSCETLVASSYGGEMKIIAIVVILLFFMSYINSQEVAKSLTIGNHWHFDYNYSTESFSTELVIGDSCIQGVNYKIIGRSPNYLPIRFERSDSTRLYQFDFSDSLEHVVFDLDWELGETYINYYNGSNYQLTVIEKGISAFWGSRKYIILQGWGLYVERTYVETLGLYDNWGYDGQSDWHIHLIGAHIDGVNYGTVVETDENLIELENYKINNFPNPFNPTTTIEFLIQNDSKVELSIYNIKGQKIKTLAQNEYSHGNHTVVWYGN